MKIKCGWCGSWINDFDEKCSFCGGINENFKRQGTGVPQTLEELKEWADKHNLPLRQMRTYIGENYTGAKAFGIYKDEATGNFIVYKNKADGTRFVRYEGPDEAYAVNELYQKMKERVAEQKRRQTPVRAAKGPVYLNTGNPVGYENRRDNVRSQGSEKNVKGIALAVILIVFLVQPILGGLILFLDRGPDTGYYNYNGSMYYWQDATNAWYLYDDDSGWDKCYEDLDDLYDNYDDYYVSSYLYSDYGVADFADSGYYVEYSTYDSDWGDWDDDYDWDDSYDWDSGGDDWDSDW